MEQVKKIEKNRFEFQQPNSPNLSIAKRKMKENLATAEILTGKLFLIMTTQVSSMIHSARPIVTPVANIVLCCFVFLDVKSGDGCTDGRTKCAKTMIPTCRDFGLAEWINTLTAVCWQILQIFCNKNQQNLHVKPQPDYSCKFSDLPDPVFRL